MNIPLDFALPVDGLIIRSSTYDDVVGLGHLLSRTRPTGEEASRCFYFVVKRTQDDVPVTSLGVEQVRDDPQAVSMNWATGIEHQRKGYASRSVKALAEWLHDICHISRIEADIVPSSEARDKTAARAGFKRIGSSNRWRWSTN